MKRINGIKKLTSNRFLNLYELEAQFRDGTCGSYYLASRRRQIEQLKAVTHDTRPDGVIVFAGYGSDRVVLIRQYRYPIDAYVYELPAGLVEVGEDPVDAGARELWEETGLTLSPLCATQPYYMSVGMTDESCTFLFGVCSGEPSDAHLEGSEDIRVVLADRAECRRILTQEHVALPCAALLWHFVNCDLPFPALAEKFAR